MLEVGGAEYLISPPIFHIYFININVQCVHLIDSCHSGPPQTCGCHLIGLEEIIGQGRAPQVCGLIYIIQILYIYTCVQALYRYICTYIRIVEELSIYFKCNIILLSFHLGGCIETSPQGRLDTTLLYIKLTISQLQWCYVWLYNIQEVFELLVRHELPLPLYIAE